MKINDVGLHIEKGRVLLSEKNKRGEHKTGGIDITTEFLDVFYDMFEKYAGKGALYKNMEIQVTILTPEELHNIEENRKRETRQTRLMLEMMTNFYTRNIR